MIDRSRLEDIVREAGRIALAAWPGAGHTVETWEKAPGNPVCAADLAVDAFLRRELGRLLPSAGWLSEETADDPARLEASTRRTFAGARVPADSLPKEDRDLQTVDKPNSIALRAAMVASGEADLLATLRWGYEWDIAAAALIAREAGAAISDAFGQPLNYNKRDPRAFGLLVSAPAIHTDAVARLASRARELTRK